ncbi:uncharacterized protein M6B38_323375 [Iris pallida]|uniref:Symplekin n=1 Tax=Iris pallida TaxID=29817 RepID=A0AAX6HAK0_IRIPA|nr:uncharacterized protein M6B38_323375 [Iris pallida]
MVGVVATSWSERASTLLAASESAEGTALKIEQLRRLKEVIFRRDPSLLPEFLPRLAELRDDGAGPVRRFLAELISEIGINKVELLPDVIPTLMSYLKDETPAVARQAITTTTNLYRNVLEKVVIQGLYSSGIDESLKSSWVWMLKLKNAVSHMAVQPGNDGVRVLAVKFIQVLILLHTPDPDVSSDPPQEAGSGFNISWLKGGHPLLNAGDLAMEASQSLRLLLDQLKIPQVKLLSNSIIIVLINSLSVIAKRRPSFYGRILSVLLSLDPATSVIKGVQVPGAHHALKNAFVACLQCTHSSAAPWRVRLLEALKAMSTEQLGNQTTKLDNISGSIVPSAEETLSDKEEKIRQSCGEAHSDVGRKRYIVQENIDLSQDDLVSGKRRKPSPTPSQETVKESFQTNYSSGQNKVPSVDSKTAARNGDSGAVKQLVDMFGVLAAQGEKAAGSLEILITSISSDLLAEVVMANIHHLPPSCPKADGEDEPVPLSYTSRSVDKKMPVMQQPIVASDTFSLSGSFPLIASLLNVQPSISRDCEKVHQRDEEGKVHQRDDVKIEAEEDIALDSSATDDIIVPTSSSIPTSVAPNPVISERINSAVTVYGNDAENIVNEIPGLESASSFDEIQESLDASHTSTGEIQGASQEHDISLVATLPLEISSPNCMVTCTSETLSPRQDLSDAIQAPTSSLVSSLQVFLPKMTISDISLTDEQKDNLQNVALVRIIEAYKQVALSGGSYIHLSLLAHLGIEFPLDLDPWGLLQKHVLSDYINNEGLELTLRVLYRLYRETEQDQDFLSSRTATSVYETFLLTVAETLRDTFPASDKSLGRLLSEVPYLSDGVLKLLECLCSPESKEKLDKDLQNGDRVTQGLTAVWNLILLRPPTRDRCLQIALQSTIHHMEEVRMKAIRLVANKLFPLSSISQKIEDFATAKLHSVVDSVSAMDCMPADGLTPGLQKGCDLEAPTNAGQQSVSPDNTEPTSDSHLTQDATSLISEAQRCMSLYFALCTKKHSLLRQIFTIYGSIPLAAKQAVHRHIPILIRTVGPSPELLGIISDLEAGSKDLLLQVLQTLTNGALPSRDLISTLRRLYNSRLKDVEIFIPILSSLSKDEVLPLIPQLVNLPREKFQAAIARLLQGSPQSGPTLTPAEVLIAIHAIDLDKDGVPLKKVTDACTACFDQRQVFTQQVLAKVLNQLVQQIPLPLLFMRTVIQAINLFPGLVEFVMEILSKLVTKQIWKYPKLWVGFLKCAFQTTPQSFKVLLQLPVAQLENALNRNSNLKPQLVEHVNQPDIKSTLPRSTLVLLGVVSDSQSMGQGQTSQGQVADTGSSADVTTEATQECSVLSDVR